MMSTDEVLTAYVESAYSFGPQQARNNRSYRQLKKRVKKKLKETMEKREKHKAPEQIFRIEGL